MSNQVHLLDNGGQRGNFDYQEQDPYYTGRKLDQELKRGPLESRACRDIIFVFIYFAVWALMGYCAYNGHKNGDISLIISPWDSADNQCGFGNAKNYPNVYILTNKEFYCVDKCPDEVDTLLNCYNCNNSKSKYPSTRVLTLCFPTVTGEYLDQVSEIVHISGSQEYIADLQETWPIIAASAGIAFVISIILTFLIRYFAGCMVWIMILLYLIIVTTIGTIAYLQIDSNEFNEYRYINDKTTLEWIAYICWGIAVLSLLIILCLVKKINQAIAVLKAAADFTRDVWESILVPIVMFIVILLFFTFWLYYSMLIYSTDGDLEKSTLSPYVELQWNNKTGWQLGLYFFALVWNVCLAISFCQFVISSACCIWYFSHMGNDMSHPISKSFCRGLFYNLGSLLYGSLVLAIVWIIKIVLEFIHKNLKDSVMGDNNALGCFLKYCKCMVSCFERFIRFLNQNAYIMIALTGQGFCDAAYDAFYLITRNAIRVAITHGLGSVFEFIGSIFVSALTTLTCYYVITTSEAYKNDIISPLAPTIAFIIVSYVIGRMFMNVYGMGVDAILMCFLVDYELHRNEGGAKSIPSTLKQFLSEYN